MKSRKQIRQKLEQFYRDVRGKRKGKKMKLQVVQDFQQVKIKDLNDLTMLKCSRLLSEVAKHLLLNRK